jgi:hypothetical protein
MFLPLWLASTESEHPISPSTRLFLRVLLADHDSSVLCPYLLMGGRHQERAVRNLEEAHLSRMVLFVIVVCALMMNVWFLV